MHFLVFLTFGFFTSTLYKAENICPDKLITKQCVIEALQPIESANTQTYND